MSQPANTMKQHVLDGIRAAATAEANTYARRIQDGKLSLSRVNTEYQALSPEARQILFSEGQEKLNIKQQEKRAKAGDMKAQCCLGIFHQANRGLEQAKKYFSEVIINQNAGKHPELLKIAYYSLGDLLLNSDPKTACLHLEQAFKLGNRTPRLLCSLAGLVPRTLSIEKVSAELFEAWQKAAQEEELTKIADEHDKYILLTTIGYLYRTGTQHSPKQFHLTEQYFQRAVKKVEKVEKEIKINALRTLLDFYFHTPGYKADDEKIHTAAFELAKLGDFGPLAVCTLKGYKVPKSPKLALKQLERSQWSWVPLYKFVCQLEIEDISPSIKKIAIEELEKIAQKAHPTALYAITALFLYYKKIEKVEAFIFWATKGTEYSDPDAHLALAEHYFSQPNPENMALGVLHYENAARLEHPVALFQMGLLHYHVSIIPKDLTRAFMLFQKAHERNHTPATTMLGQCYSFGYGTPPNSARAFQLFSEAATKNEPLAITALGLLYETGTNEIKMNPQQAFAHFQKAHLLSSELAIPKKAYGLNYGLATSKLAECYLFGIGCPIDRTKGFDLLFRLEDKSLAGQFYLGLCYELGMGTEADQDKAFACYDAIATDYIAAALRKTKFWLTGGPVQKDVEKAKSEYKALLDILKGHKALHNDSQFISNEREFPPVIAKCLLMLSICYIETQDFSKAFECLREASQLGNPLALELEIFCYEHGIGTTVNPQKAKELQKILPNKSLQTIEVQSYNDWLQQKTKNENLIAGFLSFPARFQKMAELPNHDLIYLKEKFNGLVIILRDAFSKISTKTTKLPIDLEQISAENKQHFAKIQEIEQNLFDFKYERCKAQIMTIMRTHAESIETYTQNLENDKAAYEAQIAKIENQIKQLEDIRSKMDSDHVSGQKEVLPATTQPESSNKSQLSNRPVQTDAAFQLKQKEEAEKRKFERERWKEKNKKFQDKFLAEQKKGSDAFNKSMMYLLARSYSVYQQRLPSQRILATDWQVPLQVRFKEETELLTTISQLLNVVQAQQKRDQEDLWIERELLVNFLGRLMELAKNFEGKEKRIPTEAATAIRNMLLKYQYKILPPIPVEITSNANLIEIERDNAGLRSAVENVLLFLKSSRDTKHSYETWAEIQPFINSPFLNDIVKKSIEPTFAEFVLTSSDCLKGVALEKNNLERLARYQGPYKRADLCEIVAACCQARWGTISSFVKANCLTLAITPAQYKELVNEEYIRLGNRFRHSEKPYPLQVPNPLTFSKTGAAPAAGAGAGRLFIATGTTVAKAASVVTETAIPAAAGAGAATGEINAQTVKKNKHPCG